MATKRNQQIIETPAEARQGERGPSILALLAVSVALAVLLMALVWVVVFRN